MRKCFSMLLGAGMIALLTSCNFVANPNDGTLAKDGLNRYVDWSKGDGEKDPSVGGGTGGGTTTDKFWKDWKPFYGIQIWTTGADGSVWGQEPDVDLVAGTISATKANPPVMFPVFGAFDENGSALIGTYDYSAVKKFSFKIKASRAGSTVLIGTYFTGSESKTEEIPLTTDFQNVEIPVTNGTSHGNMFYLNCAVPSADYVVTVNDVAFYDAEGNQIKDLPMTRND